MKSQIKIGDFELFELKDNKSSKCHTLKAKKANYEYYTKCYGLTQLKLDENLKKYIINEVFYNSL